MLFNFGDVLNCIYKSLKICLSRNTQPVSYLPHPKAKTILGATFAVSSKTMKGFFLKKFSVCSIASIKYYRNLQKLNGRKVLLYLQIFDELRKFF